MDDFYRPRIADKLLSDALNEYGAVLIKGPRACGKTTTARQISQQFYDFQRTKTAEIIRTTIKNNPSQLKEGQTPILFDEWQIEPEIWNIASTIVQEEHKTGLYILTGSTNIDMVKNGDNASDSITTIDMLNMSLYESGDSTGEISLSELIKNPGDFKEGCTSTLSREDIVYIMCRGGWPGCLRVKDTRRRLTYSRNITKRLLERNLHLDNGSTQDPEITNAVLCAYARNNCMLTNTDKIYKDIEDEITDRFDINVVKMYIRALKSLYIIEDIPSWSMNPLTKKHTKHVMTDPSIAAATLNIGPETLNENRNAHIRGLLFESMCVRDIKVYASALDIDIGYSFYRGNENEEIDIVLHDGGQCKALIECKLAGRDIWEAEKNLLDLESKILEIGLTNAPKDKKSEPIPKIILTGTNQTKRLNSGVFVIPLGCLKN